jgi:MFS family permease
MALPRDVLAVFWAKAARTFCYGFLSVVLPVYLTDLGVGALGVGGAVTLILLASALLTWGVRRPGERFGGRPTLLGLAGLSVLAASLLLWSRDPRVVVVAAMIGNVAVGASETGPFLALEQVVVARGVGAGRRTHMLSVYNFIGYGAAALGAAVVGVVPSYRALFAGYLLGAGLQCLAYARLGATPAEALRRRPPPVPSAPLIRRLAALFALDAFAGGFVLQSLLAYFFHARYGLGLASLGAVFSAAQLLTAASLLLAARCARRFGLLNTMVVSHLISNGVLIGIAVAPTAAIAVGLLLVRHLTSQMDVPTRQAYVMAVVGDEEREAAAVTTNLARTVAQAVSPALTGWVMGAFALSAPFLLGGGLKIAYDLLLYLTFRDVPLRPEPEE